MTCSLGIEVGAGPIERARADIVVVSFFEDERPLSGAAGRADWRLCGKLSELITDGRLKGAAGEAVLVTPRGGLQAPILVALGLGRRQDFGPAVLEDVARDSASRALALRAVNVALTMPTSELGGIPLRTRVGAIVRGVIAAMRDHRADLHLQLIASGNEVVPITETLRAMQQPGAAAGVVLRIFDTAKSEVIGSARRPGQGETRGPTTSPTAANTQVIK